MKLFLTASLLALFLSCNYSIFVHKKDIVHNQKGYIVFYYEKEEALFFPSKDTVDNEFLNQNHMDGYKMWSGEKDLEYLKQLAINQIVVQNVLNNGQSIQVDEQIKLIPVNVQYYWGDGWNLNKTNGQQKINIKYEYAKKEREFFYKIYDHRYIMSITPTRKSDIGRIEYTPLAPKN